MAKMFLLLFIASGIFSTLTGASSWGLRLHDSFTTQINSSRMHSYDYVREDRVAAKGGKKAS